MTEASLNDYNSATGEKTKKPEQVTVSANDDVATDERPKRGLNFWMCFASLITPTFLMALDLVSSKARVVICIN